MQFIKNGPDIPSELLEAHEDGQVVFFCGAGISYPAGLPGFKGLVDKIYSELGTQLTTLENEAYKKCQFDAVLDLLERRYPGGRLAVRNALAESLKPKLRRKGATETHAALLRLSRNQDGATRLVTTNFDKLFDVAAKRSKQTFYTYSAPMLPIPKKSRWNGLVYLHGKIPTATDPSALQHLIVTSGDFGLAYLSERWAARFVSELFRNYVVCFVGYSIEDPVMRYMMDALAADRMLGEATPQAYALGDCEPGNEASKINEWEAKGVKPILYDVPVGSNNHSALHKTLIAWAQTFRDGTLGKEHIVSNYALARPSASTTEDDFVGRMLWALSDPSGLPARRFAEYNPVPTLDWLEIFSEKRYLHKNLASFGVQVHADIDEKLRFSFAHRPAPFNLAPWMSVVSGASVVSQLDEVMLQLSCWLVRHLNDPLLLLWLAQRGGVLQDRFGYLVENKLEQFERLKYEGKTLELDDIRSQAPNGIPSPQMQKLWHLLLTGRIKSRSHEFDIYSWIDRFKRNGLTTSIRFELRKLLTPKIALSEPPSLQLIKPNTEDAKPLSELLGYKLVLSADHVSDAFRNIEKDFWHSAMPLLIDEFQNLLLDALALLVELDLADEHRDSSYWVLPSISPHSQNRGYHDWVLLIELLRDAWLTVLESDSRKATQLANSWFELPHPTFKRLALFAASKDANITSKVWVEWLTEHSAFWLWSMETRRETLRLLVARGEHLTPRTQAKLEAAILAGPLRSEYREDIEPERWQQLRRRSIWLRLAKLQTSGCNLRPRALNVFTKLSKANEHWALAPNQSDEFSSWIGGTDDPDYEKNRAINTSPRNRKNLVKWLKQTPSPGAFDEDTWGETCETQFLHSFFALRDLTEEGLWYSDRWRAALYAWSREGNIKQSWEFAAPLVSTMSDEDLKKLAHPVTWWVKAASESIDCHEGVLEDLCRRILSFSYPDDEETDEHVSAAINHPIGHATEALLNFWIRLRPRDRDTLPDNIEPFFTRLCDTDVVQYKHARVLLASRLITFFRVDEEWTKEHLLPLFNWDTDPREAQIVWDGFLWGPRLYHPLLIEFKSCFLDTARHYVYLGSHKRQYSSFLTYVALNPPENYTTQDFQEAIGSLPQEGLEQVAYAISQSLKGAGEKREEYWQNRIEPFLKAIWPKSTEIITGGIAESFALLSIAAGNQFPSAISRVEDWLTPMDYPHQVVKLLEESALVPQFPKQAIKLLAGIILNQSWPQKEFGECLEQAVNAAPELLDDADYLRLRQYWRENKR